jgi:hypothetical protein
MESRKMTSDERLKAPLERDQSVDKVRRFIPRTPAPASKIEHSGSTARLPQQRTIIDDGDPGPAAA